MRFSPILVVASLVLFATGVALAEDDVSAGKAPGLDSIGTRNNCLFILGRVVLPMDWHESPARMSAWIQQNGREGLRGLLRNIATRRGYKIADEDLAQLNIEYHAWSDKITGWVVTFPEAREDRDASYVAMVFDGKRTWYFLEIRLSNDAHCVSWMLIGETKDSDLQYYGKIADPSKDAFVERVRHLVDAYIEPGQTAP